MRILDEPVANAETENPMLNAVDERAPPSLKESPRSIGRVLNVLDALADFRDGASLTELALRIEMPKSSLLVLLKGMQASGHITVLNKRYRLGSTAFDLALRLLSARPSNAILRDSMHELWLASQETVVLTTIDRELKIVTYIDAIESPAAVRYTVRLGTSRPLHCTAAGQATLAFQSKRYRDAILAVPALPRLTAATITDPVQLEEKLENIRKQGLAVSRSEAIPNSIGIAAPLFNADGRVDHALLIAGPTERIAARVDTLCPLLLEAAQRASQMLRHIA